MSSELFDEVGRERNNERAENFESQLVAMGSTLGWTMVCRNVDFFLAQGDPVRSRGIDVLWGFQNPQNGRREGCLGEAKVHGTQVGLSKFQAELQTLHDNMTKFQQRQAFTSNEYVAEHIERIAWGLLAHRTEGWRPDKAALDLRSVSLKSLHRAANVTTIVFYGPDTLEAFADCGALNLGGPLRPVSYYWPPYEDADGLWARCCPPHQLAAGMLAYKTGDGRTVLWLKDTLTHKDVRDLKDIVHAWRLRVDIAVASQLHPDTWPLVADHWRSSAADSRERDTGHLPDKVHARNLTYSNLNRFDDAWPVSNL
jgi:hypothetical protein